MASLDVLIVVELLAVARVLEPFHE